MQVSFRSLLAGIVIGAMAVTAGQLPAQEAKSNDPVVVNPGKYTVLFENDRVRLLEYKDKPGDVSANHWHPDHLVYMLSSFEREFSYPDGRIQKGQIKTGEFFWAPAGEHAGKNIGTTETHALIFELKE